MNEARIQELLNEVSYLDDFSYIENNYDYLDIIPSDDEYESWEENVGQE